LLTYGNRRFFCCHANFKLFTLNHDNWAIGCKDWQVSKYASVSEVVESGDPILPKSDGSDSNPSSSSIPKKFDTSMGLQYNGLFNLFESSLKSWRVVTMPKSETVLFTSKLNERRGGGGENKTGEGIDRFLLVVIENF